MSWLVTLALVVVACFVAAMFVLGIAFIVCSVMQARVYMAAQRDDAFDDHCFGPPLTKDELHEIGEIVEDGEYYETDLEHVDIGEAGA